MKKPIKLFDNISKIITPFIAIASLIISIISINYSINIDNQSKKEKLFIQMEVFDTAAGMNLHITHDIHSKKDLERKYPQDLIKYFNNNDGGSVVTIWRLLLVNNDSRAITITKWCFYQYLIDDSGKRTYFSAEELFFQDEGDLKEGDFLEPPIILKPNEDLKIIVKNVTRIPESSFKLFKRYNITDDYDLDYANILSIFGYEYQINTEFNKDIFGTDLEDINNSKNKNEYIPYSTFILEIETDRELYKIPFYIHNKIREKIPDTW